MIKTHIIAESLWLMNQFSKSMNKKILTIIKIEDQMGINFHIQKRLGFSAQ